MCGRFDLISVGQRQSMKKAENVELWSLDLKEQYILVLCLFKCWNRKRTGRRSGVRCIPGDKIQAPNVEERSLGPTPSILHWYSSHHEVFSGPRICFLFYPSMVAYTVNSARKALSACCLCGKLLSTLYQEDRITGIFLEFSGYMKYFLLRAPRHLLRISSVAFVTEFRNQSFTCSPVFLEVFLFFLFL